MRLPAPTPSLRVGAAAVLAVLGMLLANGAYAGNPGYHSDFAQLHFGAQSMLAGVDPYPLVGIGRVYDAGWLLFYPVTALVAAIPFAWLSERAATIVFVGASTFVLAHAVTRNGWHLLPLFATEPFLSSARLGQWSLLATAAIFVPAVAAFAAAKPQAFIPVILASLNRMTAAIALGGGLVLVGVGTALLPGWFTEWAASLSHVPHRLPLFHPFGFLIPLVLLRWRRPEAWLILGMAVMPQTWGWYNVLPLLTVPASFAQSVALAWLVTAGVWVAAEVMPQTVTPEQFHGWVGGIIVVTIYLPVVALVLARRNEGELPAWLRAAILRLPGRVSR